MSSDYTSNKGYTCRDLNIYYDTLCVLRRPIIIILIYSIAICSVSLLHNYIRYGLQDTVNELFTFILYSITCSLFCILYLWSVAIIYVSLPANILWVTLPFYSRLQFYRVTNKVCIPDKRSDALDCFISEFNSVKVLSADVISRLYDISTSGVTLHYLLTPIDLKRHIDTIKTPSTLDDLIDLNISCAEMRYILDYLSVDTLLHQ